MLVNAAAIPVIAPEVEILPFDDTTYLVVQHHFKHQLRISAQLHRLLGLVDGFRNLGEIALELNKGQHVADIEKLDGLLYTGRLAQCGIIQTPQLAEARATNNYLKLRLTLLRAKHIKLVTSLFSPLFTPAFFYLSGGSMLAFIGCLLAKFIFLHAGGLGIADTVLKSSSLLLLYGVLYLSTLLHEIGHASACRRFGATPGDIGFGFYLVMPVFYADVSDAWRVPARWRVIIDLAGLYMEILLCTGLCCVFLFNHNLVLLYLCIIIILRTYGNLNPFLRFDGYWALADALRMPNLRQHANQKLLDCWAWLVGRRPSLPLAHKTDALLLLYAICSQLMVVFFLTLLLVFNKQSILYFPVHLFQTLRIIALSFGQLDLAWVKNELASLFPSLLFYILLLNFLVQTFKRINTKVITIQLLSGDILR